MSDEALITLDDTQANFGELSAKLESLMDIFEPYRTVTRTLYPEGRPAMSTATCGSGLHFTLTPNRRQHPGYFYPWNPAQGEV